MVKRRRSVEDHAFDRVRCRSSRVAGKFDVAETVESEVRLERFASLPAQNVSVGGLGRTQVLGVEFAVRLEHFAEADSNFGSSLTRNVQPRPSDHVLAEIEDVDSRRRICNRLGLEDLVDPDGLKILRDHRSRRRRRYRNRSPAASRRTRPGPIQLCSRRAS